MLFRSEFDKTVRSEWINARKRGESVYEFKESDAYKNALKELDDKAKVIRDDLIAQASRKPGGSAASQPSPQRPAERKMPSGEVWVRQPDGSYKKQ